MRNPGSVRCLALLTLSALALVSGSCGDSTLGEAGHGPVDPDARTGFYVPIDSIRVGGRGSHRIEARRDNPALGGQVELTDARFTRVDAIGAAPPIEVCCERVRLWAKGATFANRRQWRHPGDHGAAASVRAAEVLDPDQREVTVPGAELYQFRSPALLLRTDNVPAIVGLKRESSAFDPLLHDPRQEIQIALDPNVVVVPVHIHQLADRDGDLRAAYVEEQTKATFDPPGIVTRVTEQPSPRPGGRIAATTRARRWTPLAIEPDRIWSKAGIQFRLVNYEIVPQDLGLDRNLITGAEVGGGSDACTQADRLVRFHRAYEGIPGLHVYMGGTINQRLSGNLTHAPGATCGASRSCRAAVAPGDFVLLDAGRQGPRAIAHELGHYLGLRDSGTSGACGEGLLENPGDDTEREASIMHADPVGNALSSRQIERARTLACSVQQAWGSRPGFDSPACP